MADSAISGVPVSLLAMLERLAIQAPQVLLLEGGTEQSRLAAALHWAKTAACPMALAAARNRQNAVPCLQCPVCSQIEAQQSLDLHIFDGRISNKQDEENPGPIRALNMDNMQGLRSITGTAPHGEGRRMVIFQGMNSTREEALNSLLKTLEEPTEHTRFVLLAPQRAQLLPTLVSRSLCLTLPWPDSRQTVSGMAQWDTALARFFGNGQGLLDAIAAKGAVDADIAGQIIMSCQRSLARVLGKMAQNDLDRVLAPLGGNPSAAMLLQRWASDAHAMLAGTVNPARVLEGFCTRLYVLLRTRQG